MFFFDVFQRPVAQYLAIAGGQAQQLELGADAGQGVALFDAAFEPAKNRAREGDAFFAHAHGLLRRAAAQALL